MRILHVIPGDLWAGAESQVFYTLREIKRQSDHDISVILFNKSELYERLEQERIETSVFEEQESNSLHLLKGIEKILSEHRPGIIHTHEYKSHILGTVANIMSRKKVPLVRTLHGRTKVPFGTRYLKSYLILQLDNLFLYYLTKHIIAVSEELKEELTRNFRRANIYHVNNAVDVEEGSSEEDLYIRKKFGICENDFWIVTSARLVAVKNIDLLIEAANLLNREEKNINFKVSVFGEGELRERLEQKVIKHSLEGKVFFHGHYSPIYPVFRSADVFTLTSFNEGLPMSLLEAMSAGAIPVCTKVGGMAEVIEHGKSGFLVRPGDATELAEVLRFIYQNRSGLDLIRQRAKERIRQEYSIEKNVKNLLKIYERISSIES